MSGDYVIREALPGEIGRVMDFLEENFEREETINRGFVMKHGETDHQATPIMTGFSSCLVAIRGEEAEIVGTVVLFPGEGQLIESDRQGVQGEMDEAMRRVFLGSGLYEKYDPKRLMKIRKLSVHRSHRGKGLAKKLIQAGVDWAKEHEYEVVFDVFSSPAAQRAAEQVGFRKLVDIDLRELKDSKGERLLGDCGADNVVALMAIEIERNSNCEN